VPVRLGQEIQAVSRPPGLTRADVHTVAARLHVVAAVIRDDAGRVLLTQRLAHRDHGGLWEFPGGKVEAGESPAAALAREIGEELGIIVEASEPLHVVPWHYGARALALDARVVTRWRGAPHGREGQALAWVEPARLHEWAMPAADVPLIGAVRLARHYAITPDADDDVATFVAHVVRALDAGVTLIQLRLPRQAPALRDASYRAAIAACRERGATVLVNDDIALAQHLTADGVHLPARRLHELARRALPRPALVGASCHDAEELRLAQRLDCDFVTLSPVRATASHPDATPLGWDAFAAMARECAMPVYALGGVAAESLAEARRHGAFGIAGISAYFPFAPR
jgi:8-oxo-dGTP diphosphatase